MQTVAIWEDDETNRKVSLRIDYEVDANGVTLSNITPTQVEFPAEQRSIRVWTEAGRQMLVKQLRQSGSLEQVVAGLENELLTTVS